MLDVEAEFIRSIRLEIRVEGFARSGGHAVDTGIPRLREVLSRRRQRRDAAPGGTVHADSEDVGRGGATAGGVVPNDGGRPRTAARVWLQQTGREERNQKGIDAVDAAIDARVATAENGIGKEVPGGADARADSAVERVIGILRVS